LVEENKEYAMKQLQKQFRNKHHHLYKAYLQKKGRPHDVAPEDWNWLIHNKWNDSKLKVKLFFIIYRKFEIYFLFTFIV